MARLRPSTNWFHHRVRRFHHMRRLANWRRVSGAQRRQRADLAERHYWFYYDQLGEFHCIDYCNGNFIFQNAEREGPILSQDKIRSILSKRISRSSNRRSASALHELWGETASAQGDSIVSTEHMSAGDCSVLCNSLLCSSLLCSS